MDPRQFRWLHGSYNTCLNLCLAVTTPVYEIQGKTVYTTTDGGCEQEILTPMQNQLPIVIQTEMCPEGSNSLEFACVVHVETLKCAEDKVMRYIN